jgi:hypothetical protein
MNNKLFTKKKEKNPEAWAWKPHTWVFFCPKSFSLSISSFNIFINFVIIELSKTWFKKIKLLNLIESMTRVMVLWVKL